MSVAVWIFEIGAHKWSTQNVTVGGVAYSRRVIPESFAGVTERYDITGQLIAPNDIDFDVGNEDSTLSVGDLEGEFCTISIAVGGVVDRSWKFRIKRAVEYYGKTKCYCADFLQDHLEGSYPNTPNPKEVWPSDDSDVDDDYCIPVVLGTAYIPVRSVNTVLERYYVLGETAETVAGCTNESAAVNQADYCAGTCYASDEWIESVLIKNQRDETLLDAGPYTTSPGTSAPLDNTSMIVECCPGDTLTISVKAHTEWTGDSMSISWGHDLNSTDLETAEDLAIESAPYTHTWEWVVPDSPGNYLISFWTAYYEYVSGCGNIQGQRQDYTLNIGVSS